MASEMETPKVFLSWASEDREIAKRLAMALNNKGIDVWWSEWCISAGDSLRQKIDEGIARCTHFLALLTHTSLSKPWVQAELDAGYISKLNNRCRLIPVRYGLEPRMMPPLLEGLHAPEIGDDGNIEQLINDIYGITRKPALGPAPSFVEPVRSGLSIAANVVAKLFVETSVNGESLDPIYDLEQLPELTKLTLEDATDAAHELRLYIKSSATSTGATLCVQPRFFAKFDKHWKPWDPAQDALRLAADILNDDAFPYPCREIAERYQWQPRRLNPAVAHLLAERAVFESRESGTTPFLMMGVQANDETRRFVKRHQR